MSRNVSRRSIVASIVKKDLIEWTRDKFWMAISALVLVMFGIMFWLMPDSVDETIHVGIYPATLGEVFAQAAAADQDASGVLVAGFDSREALVSAIEEGRKVVVQGEEQNIQIGLAFPADFTSSAFSGEPSTVHVYVDGTIPVDVTNAMAAMVRELAYAARILALGGNPEAAFPVTLPEQEIMILGEDRAGNQVPYREQMRPMIAFIMLLMESLALAGLIAVEIQTKTVTALIVRPARTADVLWAKSITGVLLAFSQVLLILAITNSFANSHVLALPAAAAVGAVMATAMGMLTGAAGKDFMGTLFYGLFFLIPFFIPALAVLFPGSASWIVKVIPSWGIIETMVSATTYETVWKDVAGPLAYSAAWCVVLLAAGWLQLERKLQTL
jgi:ABC-2 type transport system permease protein